MFPLIIGTHVLTVVILMFVAAFTGALGLIALLLWGLMYVIYWIGILISSNKDIAKAVKHVLDQKKIKSDDIDI